MPASNDNFPGTAISGNTGTIAGTVGPAESLEVGEPTSGGVLASVWYSWTPSTTGLVIVSTDGYAMLHIFTGTAVNALTLVASSGATYAPAININVTGGVTYRIQVGEYYAGYQSTWNLTWAPPPDNWADAYDLFSSSYISDYRDTTGFTTEAGEPIPTNGPGTGPYASLWYKWVGPSDGLDRCQVSLQFSRTLVGAGLNTVLAVYTGASLAALTEVVSNDDWLPFTGDDDFNSLVRFVFTPGTTYWIQVSGYAASEVGFVQLQLRTFTLPVNENFPGTTISGGTGSIVGRVSFAGTIEAGEPATVAGSPIYETVWYTWVAPASGLVVFRTGDNNLAVALYTGSAVNALTLQAARLNSVKFTVTGGVTYRIQCGLTYDNGDRGFTMAWGPPPGNDDFANAQDLGSATSGTVIGTDRYATEETSEQSSCFTYASQSIWYKWTCPAGIGTVTFSTQGSTYGTDVAMWTGTTLGALTENIRIWYKKHYDNPFWGELISVVVPGTVYYLQVTDQSGTGGATTLGWATAAADPADPALLAAAPCATQYTAVRSGYAPNQTSQDIIQGGVYAYRSTYFNGFMRWNWPALDGDTPIGGLYNGPHSSLCDDAAGAFYWFEQVIDSTGAPINQVVRSTDFVTTTVLFWRYQNGPAYQVGTTSAYFSRLAWSPADGFLYLLWQENVGTYPNNQYRNHLTAINPSTGAASNVYTSVATPQDLNGVLRRNLSGAQDLIVTPDGALWGVTQYDYTGTTFYYNDRAICELWRYMPGGAVQFRDIDPHVHVYYTNRLVPTPTNTVIFEPYLNYGCIYAPQTPIEMDAALSMQPAAICTGYLDVNGYSVFQEQQLSLGRSADFAHLAFGGQDSARTFRWSRAPVSAPTPVGDGGGVPIQSTDPTASGGGGKSVRVVVG